jgi:hypothetical protein
MVFAGEASWRWRMLLPANDRAYDTFWRQAVRWLALPAGDPIMLSVPPGAAAGDALPLRVTVRNASFEPQRDAEVDVRVTGPDGRMQSFRAVPEAPSSGEGRYVASFRSEQSGIFRVSAEARRGGTSFGTASTSVLVGGADLEMTDPHLNQQLLQRLAGASGGRVLSEDQLGELEAILKASIPNAALAVRRDLWHTGWSFAVILILLGTEWILRRRWGLR